MDQLTKPQAELRPKSAFKFSLRITLPSFFMLLASRLMLLHMVLCFIGFSLALAAATAEQPLDVTRLGLIFCLLFFATLGTGYGIWLEFKNSE